MTNKSLVKRKIETAAERYADNVALRTAITAIPWVGSPIDAILTTWAGRAANQRIGTLVNSLQEQFAMVREDAVKKSYLESEEWLDAVIRAFEVSARTREIDKIRLYARILVGAACGETPGAPTPEVLLSTLAELSQNEILLARLIGSMPGSVRIDTDKARQPHRVVTQAAWDQVIEQAPAGVRANLMFHLKRLERTGLIAEVTGSSLDYGGGVYEPTPTLFRILAYLSSSGTQPEPS